jgi:phage-related protein
MCYHMTVSPRWEVDDYRGPQGARPVKAFLDGLAAPAKAKVYAALEMLATEGDRLRLPRSRALGGGLFEIRVQHPDGPFRIIYCFRPGRKVLLLHGFVNRTQQIPAQDLGLAKERKPD